MITSDRPMCPKGRFSKIRSQLYAHTSTYTGYTDTTLHTHAHTHTHTRLHTHINTTHTQILVDLKALDSANTLQPSS